MNRWYSQEKHRLIINVYVQPGAKQTEVQGFFDAVPKIRLAAKPTGGLANEALLKVIADWFSVPRCQVILLRGGMARYKRIEIMGSKIDPCSVFPA